MKLAPPCVLDDISQEDYAADPCDTPSLSASIAHVLVTRSPYHAWLAHPKLGAARRASTKQMDFGTAVHRLVLGKGADLAMVPYDDMRTAHARKLRDAARAANRVPIVRKTAFDASVVSTAVLMQLAARGIALDGKSERTVVWTENGVLCRGRIDHLSKDVSTVYDVKCVESADPEVIPRQIVAHGAHIQAAAYLRAVGQIWPEMSGRVRFVFLFIEMSSLHPAQLALGRLVLVPWEFHGSLAALGEMQWRRACHTWGESLRTDFWPTYQEPYDLEAPPYALAAEERFQLTSARSSYFSGGDEELDTLFGTAAFKDFCEP